jgi:hypothetical protein
MLIIICSLHAEQIIILHAGVEPVKGITRRGRKEKGIT